MGCQYYDPNDDGAKNFTVAMPRLTFGRGALDELGARVALRGDRRVALFTDPLLANGPIIARALQNLRTAGCTAAVFSDIRIEPDDHSVHNGARFLTGSAFDIVVSIGGGSVIDTAKAAMVIARYGGDIGDYMAAPVGMGKQIPGPLLPHIACPTTSGTGSESTPIAVIRLSSEQCKFVFASRYILPDEAIVDPACTDHLGAHVVASTGFDMLSHALECFTARPYTRWAVADNPALRPPVQGANPWSDLIAREALSIAGQYLEPGVCDADATHARDQLSWGATLAGIAFGHSGTHLPHAMSYGVTHLMREIQTPGYSMPAPFIPHGISVIVNAPAIFQYCAKGAPERHLHAAKLLGGEASATAEDAGEVLAQRLVSLMRATGMPNGLSDLGFGERDIAPLTQSSLRQRRAIDNAPRESNAVDMENMYRAALKYW